MESQKARAANGVEVILDKRLDRESRLALLTSAYDRSRDPSLLEALEQAMKYPGPRPTYPALRKFVDGQATEWTSGDSIQMIVEWKKKWPGIDGAPDDKDLIGTLKKQLVEQKVDLKYTMLAPFLEEVHKLRMQDIAAGNYNAKAAFENVVRGKNEPLSFDEEILHMHCVKEAIRHTIAQAELFNQKNTGPGTDALLNDAIDNSWNLNRVAVGDHLAKQAFINGITFALVQVQVANDTHTIHEMLEVVQETLNFD
ncbi:hypothetical protein BC567DRAFT_297500 [Phyllosticta citribraziliensis]